MGQGHLKILYLSLCLIAVDPISNLSAYSRDPYYEDYVQRKLRRNNEAKMFTAVVVGVIAVAVGSYWYARESNDSVCARAKRLLTQFHASDIKTLSSCTSLESIHKLFLSKPVLRTDLFELSQSITFVYNVIDDRYNSMLAPWNNTSEMAQMYRELSSVQELIKSIDRVITAATRYEKIINIVAQFQASRNTQHFASLIALGNKYPALNAYEKVCDAIAVVEELKIYYSDLTELYAQLKDIKYTLFTSDCYKAQEAEYKKFTMIRDMYHHLCPEVFCCLSDDNTALFEHFDNIMTLTSRCYSSYAIVQEFLELTKHYGCSYPCLTAYDRICKTLNYLDGHANSHPLLVQCANQLQQIKIKLLSSERYISEKRAYELYLEECAKREQLRRIAEAQERQARALERQARAQQAEIDALEYRLYWEECAKRAELRRIAQAQERQAIARERQADAKQEEIEALEEAYDRAKRD